MAQQNLPERILTLLGSEKYQPLDKIDLSHALDLPPDERNQLRGVLRELLEDGQVVLLKKNRYALPKKDELFVGRFDMNARGFGFVISEDPEKGDLFIAGEHTGVAMHGDRVEAKLRRSRGGDKRGSTPGRSTTEGEIVRVITRANSTLVGVFQRGGKAGKIIADDPRIPLPITVTAKSDLNPEPGDKVVVDLDEWTQRYEPPTGRIIEVLGASDAPGVDMLSIIRKYRLPAEFPERILAAAEKFPTTVPASDTEGREDLRDLTIFTIDPDDARDFDDAICVERTDRGWLLGVHIADVSHYVTPGTELDKEAWERGNSTYLPDRVLPMLPERLSNGLCSLRPDEDRLTFTVWMRFDSHGNQQSASFSRSVIRSKKRLTYQEAFAVLEGRAHSPVETELLEAWELAALLRKNRFAHGSLDLDFPEVKVRVDNDGRAIAIEKVEHDRSHQLIEEFMLSANETVAREIKDRTIPSIYRIHEKPDPEKLSEYREVLALAGYKVGDLSVKGEVQKLLESLSGQPDEPVLKVGLLRSLKRATYDVRALGHYGLAKANYTHFTSPIRRYADLVVHRVLGAMIDHRPGKIQPAAKDLAVTAEHISTTERTSADAEREASKLKKLQFFALQLGKTIPDHFTGLISDIKPYGLVVELIEYSLTGLVHISDLTDDYFLFDPVRRRFTGRRTGIIYAVGLSVPLIVTRVDPAKNQIDFKVAPGHSDASTNTSTRREEPRDNTRNEARPRRHESNSRPAQKPTDSRRSDKPRNSRSRKRR
ncbi:MAG: ribonuclease R [Chthoniobacterales bacterium]